MNLNASAPLIARRYHLQEMLGKGGMGAVYHAMDRLTGRDVALKRVGGNEESFGFGDSTDGQDFRLALAREFKLAASLRHPNIIQVLDYGFDEQRQPFFTMELLSRPQTLYEACQNKTLEERLGYFVQVLHALTYLHRRGIVHYDLKPANILIVRDEAKVVDFGLAMMHERSAEGGHSGMTAGTLAYMAPEMLLGEGGGVTTDLYAVGMMAFEVFSGAHPFDVKQPSVLVHQILSTMPNVEAMDIPLDLALIFLRLVDKEPSARYGSATEVIQAINRVGLGHYPVESSATRESFLQAARLVGRDVELSHLTTALNNAMHGHGSGWLIGGESGVGKSRLVDELRSLAMVRGATVMRGQAADVGSRPYEVWLPIVRWLCLLADHIPDEEIAVLLNFVTDLDRLLHRDLSHYSPAADSPETLRKALLNFMRRVISSSGPLVILLDDLHWGGSESLNLLALLSHELRDLPLLVIGTYRDNERPELPREIPYLPLMKLKRLDEQGIAELSAAMLGSAGRRPQVVELLRRESEGNVFFIIEVVRVLALEVDRLDNIGLATLPPRVFAGSIKTVIQRRLNSLTDDERYLVTVAAVMGRSLDVPVLKAVAPHMDVEAWLTNCVNASVLEADEGRWQFSHDKLREALIDELVLAERQILHRRIAQAMELFYAASPLHAAALAYHWGLADDHAREFRYLTIGAQQALGAGGYEEAIRAFHRADSLLNDLPLSSEERQQRQAEVRSAIGSAQLGLGLYDVARRLFEESLTLMTSIGYAPGQAQALRYLGTVGLAVNDLEFAEQTFESALALYQQLGDTAGIVETLNRLGDVAYETGSQERAKQLYQESLTLARQHGTGWQIAGAARATRTAASVSLSDSEHERAQALLLQTLRAHESRGDTASAAETLDQLGRSASSLGRHTDAAAYHERSATYRHNLGDMAGMARSYELLAGAAMAAGASDQAWEAYRRMLDSAREVETAYRALLGMAGMLLALQEYGRAFEVLAYLAQNAHVPDDLQDEIEARAFEAQQHLPDDSAQRIWDGGKRADLQQVINALLQLR
jgi:serine/threonine protein kinase/tetratricopeptide (TPR) repeat protein